MSTMKSTGIPASASQDGTFPCRRPARGKYDRIVFAERTCQQSSIDFVREVSGFRVEQRPQHHSLLRVRQVTRQDSEEVIGIEHHLSARQVAHPVDRLLQIGPQKQVELLHQSPNGVRRQRRL